MQKISTILLVLTFLVLGLEKSFGQKSPQPFVVTDCAYTPYDLVLNSGLCGSTCTVTLSGFDNGVSYQLKNSTNGNVGSPVVGSSSIVQVVFYNVPVSASATTYNVVAKKSGCSASAPLSYLTVTGSPVTSGSVTLPNPATICANSSNMVTYTAAGTSGGPFTYIWKNNGLTVQDGGTTFTTNIPGTYSVDIAGTCNSVTLNCSPFTVNLATGSPGPISGVTSIQQPTSGSTAYSVSAAANATSYAWTISPSTAGTISGTTTTANVTWSTFYSGSASITCTALGSCGSVSSSPLTVNVVPASDPNCFTYGFSISPQGATVCGTTSIPTLTLSGSTPGVNYQLAGSAGNVGAPLAGTGNAISWSNVPLPSGGESYIKTVA